MAPRLHRVVLGGEARHRESEDRGNAWKTPPAFVEEIRRAVGGAIDLDPATELDNPPRARRFYTAADDGLRRPWRGRVFCNPPYSPFEPWVDKAIAAEAGMQVYLLLPVQTDAVYHQRRWRRRTDVPFLRGRLRFVKTDGGGLR